MSITLTIPEKKANKTVYERVIEEDGIDLADVDWDWCTFIDCPTSWEEAKDGYDKFTLLCALSMIIDENDCADVGAFLWENKDVFEPFFNKNNRYGYRPKDYDDPQPDTDDGFYEAYMMPFGSLLVGNYSDKDYEYLYNALAAKADAAAVAAK